MREFVPEPCPTWAKDIRWQKDKFYASIAPWSGNRDIYAVIIELKFDGEYFGTRLLVEERDMSEIGDVLDELVDRIDWLLANHGFTPYRIRSTDEQEEEVQEATDTPA